jgi:predicted alpha/beta-hydrolase family hydrolase
VRGLAFLGFPLHPAGKPATERAAHIDRVAVPKLFVQGTRDELAEWGLLHAVVERLGARAALHAVEDADHAFHVPARSGRQDLDVRKALSAAMAAWMTSDGAAGGGLSSGPS